MAKIGVDNFRYALLTEAEDGTPSYSEAKKPAKAIDCKVSIENNTNFMTDDIFIFNVLRCF